MLQPKKITSLLFITILLITSLGNAFGFVACDHGCFSAAHHKSHHTGEHTEDRPEGFTEAYYLYTGASDDLCRDYLIQLSDTLEAKKELVKLPFVVFPLVISAALSNTVDVNLPMFFSYLKSPPEILQTILDHRTIVLIL